MKFYEGVRGGKRNQSLNLVAIQIIIWPWCRFALSECLEYDDRLGIFGGKGALPDGYLNELRRLYLFTTSATELCALRVLLVYFVIVSHKVDC